MKILKKTGIVLLVILIVAQFFGPEKNEGELTSLVPFINETNPPEAVHKILETTCYDCHSNVTRYPWYNKITPVNYWLAHHVKEGKEHLNFSVWSEYSLKRKAHKFEELYEEVEEKHMPLKSYTWTHDDARLSEEQIQAVVSWAKQMEQNYKQQISAE